jgi:hypothetical protein
MKKTEYHGVCVISKIGGGVIGLACVIRMAKELPKQTSRITGNQVSKTYWFNTLLEAQAFYDKNWVEIRRTA